MKSLLTALEDQWKKKMRPCLSFLFSTSPTATLRKKRNMLNKENQPPEFVPIMTHDAAEANRNFLRSATTPDTVHTQIGLLANNFI